MWVWLVRFLPLHVRGVIFDITIKLIKLDDGMSRWYRLECCRWAKCWHSWSEERTCGKPGSCLPPASSYTRSGSLNSLQKLAIIWDCEKQHYMNEGLLLDTRASLNSNLVAWKIGKWLELLLYWTSCASKQRRQYPELGVTQHRVISQYIQSLTWCKIRCAFIMEEICWPKIGAWKANWPWQWLCNIVGVWNMFLEAVFAAHNLSMLQMWWFLYYLILVTTQWAISHQHQSLDLYCPWELMMVMKCQVVGWKAHSQAVG